MFCSNCGSRIEDGAAFCERCGAPAVPEGAQPDSVTTSAPTSQIFSEARASQPSQDGSKTSRTALITVAACALVVVVGIAIGLFACNGRGGGSLVVVPGDTGSQSVSSAAAQSQGTGGSQNAAGNAAGNAQGQTGAAGSQATQSGSARIIDMPLYTVEIPEYWVGKVDVVKDGDTLTINAKGYSDGDLIRVSVDYSPYSESPDMGDIGGSLMQYASTSNGYRVEMWATRWTYLASSEAQSKFAPKYSDELKSTCIQLQTGGAVTLEEAQNTPYGSSNFNDMVFKVDEYINSNVILKVKNGGATQKTS